MPRIAYPECGKIINTHGCHGGVKVEPWCDSPEVFASLPAVYVKENQEYRAIPVLKASVFRDFVFAELAGVDSMEAAERLRGTVLYAKREDLKIPEDTVLVAELIGLPVYHAKTKEKLGEVVDVIHPANIDIYVIRTANGEAMVPAVAEFVKSTDVEEGVIIAPIEGMLP